MSYRVKLTGDANLVFFTNKEPNQSIHFEGEMVFEGKELKDIENIMKSHQEVINSFKILSPDIKTEIYNLKPGGQKCQKEKKRLIN